MQPTLKQAALLPLLLLGADQALAAPPPVCEMILCQNGCYEGKYRDHHLTDVECDRVAAEPGYTKRTFAASMAPDPVVIECEPLGWGDHLCEVHPIGEFSYSWSTSGPISLPYPGSPEFNAQHVSCNGTGMAVLSVTVTSPTWTVNSRNKYIQCSQW